MPWGLIVKFAWEVLTGEVYRLWAAHKQKEADNVENEVNSLGSVDIDKQLLQFKRPE